MKLLIINNLRSGLGDGGIYDFIRSLAGDNDEFCIRCTNGVTDINDLLYDATSFDAVVASGGDGTIATVSHKLAYTNVPVLPYPAGTANLLSENLLSPLEPHALAKLIKQNRLLDFDLGEISCNSKEYGFGIMAGAGYDAAIMKGAEPNKALLGPVAYFQSAITHPNPQVSKITLHLDDKVVECEGLGVLIMNFARIQFNISISHNNQPRDGELEVVVLKAQNAIGLIPALLAGILDRDGSYPHRSDALEFYKAQSVYVEADPPLQVQFDGEVIDETTPFSARILPHAISFFVSEEGLERFTGTES